MIHRLVFSVLYFFFNDTATTEIYTLSLHDALPISGERDVVLRAAEQAGGDARVGRRLGLVVEIHRAEASDLLAVAVLHRLASPGEDRVDIQGGHVHSLPRHASRRTEAGRAPDMETWLIVVIVVLVVLALLALIPAARARSKRKTSQRRVEARARAAQADRQDEEADQELARAEQERSFAERKREEAERQAAEARRVEAGAEQRIASAEQQ